MWGIWILHADVRENDDDLFAHVSWMQTVKTNMWLTYASMWCSWHLTRTVLQCYDVVQTAWRHPAPNLVRRTSLHICRWCSPQLDRLLTKLKRTERRQELGEYRLLLYFIQLYWKHSLICSFFTTTYHNSALSCRSFINWAEFKVKFVFMD